MKTCFANGVRLAYEEYGSGDRYLISAQRFFFKRCHMAELAEPPYNYHVFLVQLRGSGESEHIFDSEPRDYVKIWGEDIIAFAREMGIEKFYYSGISHGNWAGWYIALHRPELLLGFAAFSGIVQFGLSWTPAPKKPVDASQLVGNREALDAMAWAEPWPTWDPERIQRRESNHEEHLQFLLKCKEEEFSVGRLTDTTACGAQTEEDFYYRLSCISVPLLLVNGALDPLAKVEDALRISKIVPNARLVVFQELGHGGPDEYPEQMASICNAFFAGLGESWENVE